MTARLLRPADLPAAMRLKEAAGWNQTEQDWRNVMELEPEGCFALDCDGAAVATATAICYGAGLAWIGIVATDMGRPLYQRLGFEDECAVERWHRPASAAAPPATEMESGPIDFALDRTAFGADRRAVLGRVAVHSAVIPGCGYALCRPGSRAAYFGPAVARSAEAARALLAWFLARHPGQEVYWDLLPGNAEALRLAREFGFERRRVLVRMARPGVPQPPPFLHNDAGVFAIAGFEYG